MMVVALACNIIAVPYRLMTVCVVAGCFGRFPTGILLGPKLIFVVEMHAHAHNATTCSLGGDAVGKTTQG
jgi:hypothetical protein